MPWAVVALVVAGVSGAPAASAVPNPTITVEFDGTSVNAQGVVEPSLIFRGKGFMPLPVRPHPPSWGKSVHVYNTYGRPAFLRSADDDDSTMEKKFCTRTVPSSCVVIYEAGELRPFRLFLGASSPGYGQLPGCGQTMFAHAIDEYGFGARVGTNVQFRIPCDTYTPRPATPIL